MKRLLVIAMFTIGGVFGGGMAAAVVTAVAFPPPKPDRDTEFQYNVRVAVAVAGCILGGIVGYGIAEIGMRRLQASANADPEIRDLK
jgi:membrane protein YqaA with SNARE-associated domain